MRPGANGWVVVGTIATVVGVVIAAIPAAFEILDRWQQRPTTAPPTGPEPTPTVQVETTPQEPPFSPSESPQPTPVKMEPLINSQTIPLGSAPTMAIALDGDSKDVELMEAALAQAASSAEMRLVSGFFKPAFRERGFLRAAYEGDTDALTSSGALAAVGRILIGRVDRACRATGQFDSDLVTCDVDLYFKIFDRHGAIADTGHVAVAGAGFSESTARDRAIEMLVQQHGKRVISTK